ncbi:MAG: hypothetical protein RIR18_95 [Pseudomonadota bacterium]
MKAKGNSAANTVRIIGGQWRRSLLHFPDSVGLRPTPDRVRETLFNWLGQELNGQRCLDLFAGSGALGFEAASRGAEKVVLVEQSPVVRRALVDNQQRLKAGAQIEILGGDALKIAAQIGGQTDAPKFDVLFLDPPYHQGWLEKIAPLLGNLLKPEGSLYVESEHPLGTLGDWGTVREGKAGQVYYHLMRVI